MRKNNPLTSACCGAEMRVSSADEGTACYICLKCFEPCDPKPSPSLEIAKEITKQHGFDGEFPEDYHTSELQEAIQEALDSAFDRGRKSWVTEREDKNVLEELAALEEQNALLELRVKELETASRHCSTESCKAPLSNYCDHCNHLWQS